MQKDAVRLMPYKDDKQKEPLFCLFRRVQLRAPWLSRQGVSAAGLRLAAGYSFTGKTSREQ